MLSTYRSRKISFLLLTSLLPSVPPSACALDGCCSGVSEPGGSFQAYSGRKGRRSCGGRGWAKKWPRFSRISTPICLQQRLSAREMNLKVIPVTLASKYLWRGHMQITNAKTHLSHSIYCINIYKGISYKHSTWLKKKQNWWQYKTHINVHLFISFSKVSSFDVTVYLIKHQGTSARFTSLHVLSLLVSLTFPEHISQYRKQMLARTKML